MNSLPVVDTTYNVQNLIEGNEYEFRIIAVNDIVESAPSRPCPMVKVDDQPNKPKIDVRAVRDITVKAGQDFSINVPFTAFLKPTTNWSTNNDDEGPSPSKRARLTTTFEIVFDSDTDDESFHGFEINSDTAEDIYQVNRIDDIVEENDSMPRISDLNLSDSNWEQSLTPSSNWLKFNKKNGSNIQAETPIDIFNYFFDEHFVEQIRIWTNVCGIRKYKKFEPMSTAELRTVLGMIIVMGINRMSDIKNH